MWLLEPSALEAMQKAIEAGVQPTTDQQAEFEARAFGANENGPRLLTAAGSSAEIAVSGVLTKSPDFLAMLFGGGNTTYADINAAIAAAEQDSAVEQIILKIDSPGGQFDGLFSTIEALQAAKKPVKASVTNVAASAAYAIAAQADTIEAVNKAARFGSVGVVASFNVSEDRVEISSTDAPKKRPNVTTPEGQAIVKEELDALHSLFAGALADGRGTTVEKVNADFGQGATLLAEEALNRGMIDSIEAVKMPAITSRGTKKEVKTMDLQELKAQHSDLCSLLVQEGVNKERDRVVAHLTMGEASGDMKTAISAVQEGSEMTNTLQATYLAAGMNRTDAANRQDDDQEAAQAADGADADDEAQDTGADAVAATVEANLGVAKED